MRIFCLYICKIAGKIFELFFSFVVQLCTYEICRFIFEEIDYF